jgi:hypothetical protein
MFKYRSHEVQSKSSKQDLSHFKRASRKRLGTAISALSVLPPLIPSDSNQRQKSPRNQKIDKKKVNFGHKIPKNAGTANS